MDPVRNGDVADGRSKDSEKGVSSLGKVPGITIRTVVMAMLVAMGGFIFGYDTGQISGFLQMQVFLERFGTPTAVDATNQYGYHFSNVRSGLIVGMLSIGTLVGCLSAGPLANKFGRRTCIPYWCLIFCIGVTIQMAVASGEWVGIVIGRLVAGFGVGALSVLVPMYMAETSPVPVRGAVISCYQLFITIGIFTADCINYGTETMQNSGSYRITMGIGYIWAILLGVGILFLPESPRHDWNHDQTGRARSTLAKFYGLDEHHEMIENECYEINQVMENTQGDHPWYEALTGPRMMYRVLLGVALQMFQQLTGANYFFYYGTTIFSGVGIPNPFVTAMILGGVNVGATFVGVYMARHFKRRPSLWVAALWQCMCFLVFASVGQFSFNTYPTGDPRQKTPGVVMIVFACLFICGFATTWGPLVWACISEMFPYRYRGVAMGFATSSNWFWNFLLAFFTPFITNDIQFAYGYVFAGCNLAAAVIVFFCLVESSGRTLEEVDAMYLLHVNPITSSKFEFDENVRKELGGIGTDKMRLRKGGRSKAKEAGDADEGVLQREGTVKNATTLGRSTGDDSVVR